MIPSLNYTVLADALHALKNGNIRYCEMLGFTYDEMNALNQLSLDALFALSRAAVPFLQVTIQHDVLRQLLAQSQQEIQHQQLINRAIRLGGSITLLNHFFGLSSNEIAARRRLQGIQVPQGRTPIPSESLDAAIWQQWQIRRLENIESLNALEAMMHITEALASQEPTLSLTVVWNRITQCEKEALRRRPSYGR